MAFSFQTHTPVQDDYAVRSVPRRPTGMDLDEDDEENAKFAVPGEMIADAKQWMRGHGTYLDSANNAVLAGVAGKIERVNKLVSMRAVRGRYRPEVGDLVVGRIVEVQARRWKVDVGARLDAILMLSSINLPGGVQRRKLESDELRMRNFFAEGDLLVAEVQAFFQDGSISLHTRSLRYGKLRNGQLVRAPSGLVPRLKSHFITMTCGVELIVGLNGFIWVSTASAARNADLSATQSDNDALDAVVSENLYSNKNDDISPEKQEAISRVIMCIQILAEQGVQLTENRVSSLWEASLDSNTSAMDDSSTWTVQDLARGAAGRTDLVNRLPILCEA